MALLPWWVPGTPTQGQLEHAGVGTGWEQGPTRSAFWNFPCEKALFLLLTPRCPSLLDVNECITRTHSCRLGESCINTVGSFRCQRDSSCGTGYELTEDNDCKGATWSQAEALLSRGGCGVATAALGSRVWARGAVHRGWGGGHLLDLELMS